MVRRFSHISEFECGLELRRFEFEQKIKISIRSEVRRRMKSYLMSLPNELFDYILVYLSSCDIVQSFYGINERLNILIQRYIRQMDVSSQTDEWFQRYLPSIQPWLTQIQFDHEQLLTLFPNPSTIATDYPSLKSIVWYYRFGDRDYQSLSYLLSMKSQIHSFTFHLGADDDADIDDNYLAFILLQKDSSVEHLTFYYKHEYAPMWFSLKPKSFKGNSHLKRLTIKLHYVHDLFVLMESLSQLEYLNVEVCEMNKRTNYNYRSLRRKMPRLSRCLKEVLIDSMDFSYSHLLLFLEPFQTSLEYLTLDMTFDDQIDGHTLQSTIISKMPQLKRFQFAFHIFVNQHIDVDQSQ